MKLFLLLATLTLLASCIQSPTPTPTPTPAPKAMEESKTMTEDTMTKPEGAKPEVMMKDDTKDTMMMSGEMMDQSGIDTMKKDEAKMMKPTGYVNYDEMKVSEALAGGQKVALFFHATWCPSCKALDKAINSEISSIPSDALIVKVDYDTSTEMKKKYGVTNQHTTVIIDKDMNLISKKLGAKSVGEVFN